MVRDQMYSQQARRIKSSVSRIQEYDPIAKVHGAEGRSVADPTDHSHGNAANPSLEAPATTIGGPRGNEPQPLESRILAGGAAITVDRMP